MADNPSLNGDPPNLAHIVESPIRKSDSSDNAPIPDNADSPHSPRPHMSIPSTPSARTGFPRSLAYISPAPSRQNSKHQESQDSPISNEQGPEAAPTDPYMNKFFRTHSEFRGALEYINPEQKEKEREAIGKRERAKRRESWLDSEAWNPRKWLSGFEETSSPNEERQDPFTQTRSPSHSAVLVSRPISPSHSMTQPQSPKSPSGGAPRWSRLRSLLPQVTANAPKAQPPQASVVAGKAVNITDELIAGGLSALILRMWFERDEHSARCIPVLLHRLRIRISDSLHPLHGTKAVFRIECEYANGAARWVIYRQLRDFVSLHAHYRVSNVYKRNIDALPEFPRTSLPYFKFLKKENREKGRDKLGRPEFARLQRESLENYLIGLIRAVMFHPTSNRLSRFLEISALSIRLAQSGGWQAKAGVLHIEAASGPKGTFARKGLGWREKTKPKWCAVRESYLVVLKDPGELEIFEVFMLDTDFKIERPKRVYRQGFSLLHHGPAEDRREGSSCDAAADIPITVAGDSSDQGGTLRSIKFGLSRLFHPDRTRHIASTHSLPTPMQSHARSNSGSSSSFAMSVDSEDEEGPTTLMVDPSTNVDPLRGETASQDEMNPTLNKDGIRQESSKNKKRVKDVSMHTFFIENSQMRLKLFARNTRQMQQWIAALERTAAASHWVRKNRFDSFAPIRLNVAAQWLVDGRDYFWNLSRALLLAKETIYIHDWWLSPELQMRRPGKPNYRLDRLLQRKAHEGVKVFIILYKEVSSRTTPTDSNYTKQKLTSLHPNIMIQRSPSHFQTGTYYWAHHEKMCVIDEAIAFMGGLDLCFGRWDTAQHVLVDDGDMAGPEGCEYVWPGKDYSNERVMEFHTLNKPEQDMYDRTKVPRMPWHDVALQIVGQPARDLCRHFVQRWNYLLRNKNHSRVMPFLLPPPEFKSHELTDHGLTGTCELQICRSAGPWSLGTLGRVEHSIQNAYLKAIQLSEHFVYIENQFFITSTVVNDVQIENRIGDALVHRIIRAHRQGTKWKAVIVIPSLPGFPSPIDQGDASAIRIILECQSRTIARGPNSIFSRLRKEEIDPDEYITFFSLRGWGKLKGGVLTTEQVYIHGKTMIVDDRLVIIGSANINERSQRGDRDSELASVIRDTDMIDGSMGGEPYQVGRFAHTLRVRLMREHLGVDVDAIYEEDLMAAEPMKPEMEMDTRHADPELKKSELTGGGIARDGRARHHRSISSVVKDLKGAVNQGLYTSGNETYNDVGQGLRKADIKSNDLGSTADDKALEEEQQGYDREGNKQPNFASSLVSTFDDNIATEHPTPQSPGDAKPILNQIPERVDQQNGRVRHDGDLGEDHLSESDPAETQVPHGSRELFGALADVSKGAQTDDRRLHARHGKDDSSQEEKAAVRVRSVLRKHLSIRVGAKPWTLPVPGPVVDPHGFEDPLCDEFFKDVWVAAAVHNTEIYRRVFHALPDDLVTTWKQYREFILHHERLQKPTNDTTSPPDIVAPMPSETGCNGVLGDKQSKGADTDQDTEKAGAPAKTSHEDQSSAFDQQEPQNRRPSRPDEPFEQWERDEMETLLMEVRGHLVLFPTRFLECEDIADNFLFNTDRLLPLLIYD